MAEFILKPSFSRMEMYGVFGIVSLRLDFWVMLMMFALLALINDVCVKRYLHE